MAIWKTYSVACIIKAIADELFVLPVIQRSLVWEEEKMKLLFDTLLKGDSFGGIMVIEEEKDKKPLFEFRPFAQNTEVIASRQAGDRLTQPQNFVIDGQQRLQSFYIGLKGSYNGKVLYFDLFSDYNSEFEFQFESDLNKLPSSSKHNDDRAIKNHFWISAKSLFEKLQTKSNYKLVVKEFISLHSISDEMQKEYIENNIYAFYENVMNSETIGVSIVNNIDRDLPDLENRQRIVELFRRLNEGATKLSSFDLVASILKGFDWKMEGFLRETIDDYKEIGLSQDNLIKLIFILQDNHTKEMASIEASDATFALENSGRIKATLKALKDFIVCAKVYDYYIEKNRSFIPLFFIAYHLYHKQINEQLLNSFFDKYDTSNEEFPLMKKWLFHSLINGVFKSKGAGWISYKTGVRKLLEEIKKHKNSPFPTNELFAVYRNHPISFTQNYDSNNLDNLDSSFVYYLMYDLTKNTRNNDIDHIMPKSILNEKKYDWSKINSIKNYQLIDTGTNRGAKNGKAFSAWINNPDYVTDKNAFVAKHLIPIDESLWSEDKFEDFSEERAKLILAKLKNYQNVN